MITSIAYIMCKQGQQREAYVALFLAKFLYFQSRVDRKIVIINRRESFHYQLLVSVGKNIDTMF